jgi:hypothetical protein
LISLSFFSNWKSWKSLNGSMIIIKQFKKSWDEWKIICFSSVKLEIKIFYISTFLSPKRWKSEFLLFFLFVEENQDEHVILFVQLNINKHFKIHILFHRF